MNTLARNTFIGVSLLGASLSASAGSVTLTGFSSSQPDRFVIPAGDLMGSFIGDGYFFELPLLNFTVNNGSAADTLTFTLNIGPGEVLKEVLFREAGELVLNGPGVGAANGEITVNGVSKTAGDFFVFSGGGNSTFDFNNGEGGNFFNFSLADNLSSVNVTISNFLLAFASGPGGGTITKTTAQLLVVTQPIPLPPAAWMLGSALVGLVTLGRRRLAAA